MKRVCRTCLHWKRRGPVAGTCWLPRHVGASPLDTRVLEHDCCPHHTPKAIRPGLPRPPPRHAAGVRQVVSRWPGFWPG